MGIWTKIYKAVTLALIGYEANELTNERQLVQYTPNVYQAPVATESNTDTLEIVSIVIAALILAFLILIAYKLFARKGADFPSRTLTVQPSQQTL